LAIFKKGLIKDLSKYFANLTVYTENLLVGEFTLRNLTEEYVLTLLIKDESKLKITLSSNQYIHFESILENLKFLLSN
jgi:hypothetical protein